MSPPKIAALMSGLLVVSSGLIAGNVQRESFELRDGDRVVLLGGSLIEREQKFGYWETLLTAASAGKNVTFRNLGWSGDTVWGESRGMFEPQLGYERLIEQVQAAQPTLVLIAYGNNEAFAGEGKWKEFMTQYSKLLGDLKADNRRFVLISPLFMEADQVPRDPDSPADHAEIYNKAAGMYSGAVQSLAGSGGHEFIDLLSHQRTYPSAGKPLLTVNGLQLSDAGYRETARWLAGHTSAAVEIADFDFDTAAAQELRAAVIAKNELFFHRWRPQNFTYLFGFRTYEQGQNAAEVPRFDPLINEAERRIGALAETVRTSGRDG